MSSFQCGGNKAGKLSGIADESDLAEPSDERLGAIVQSVRPGRAELTKRSRDVLQAHALVVGVPTVPRGQLRPQALGLRFELPFPGRFRELERFPRRSRVLVRDDPLVFPPQPSDLPRAPRRCLPPRRSLPPS